MENFNMDEWVMKIDAIDNTNDLRNVKDYIHYKLRMEVRKEISDNSIQIKEQELAALKSKRDKELEREWQPRGLAPRVRGYGILNKYPPEVRRQILKQLDEDGGDETNQTDVHAAVKKVMEGKEK